jgi:hypothetical protein
MLDKSIYSKISRNERVFLDSEVTEDELMDLIDSSKSQLISNLAEVLSSFINKGLSGRMFTAIEGLVAEDDSLRKQLINLLNIKEAIKSGFEPKTQSLKFAREGELPNSQYIVSDKTKKLITEYADEDSIVDVQLILKKNSLFIYEELVKEETTRFEDVCKSSKKFLTAMTCGMILTASIGSSAIAKDVVARAHEKSNFSFNVKKVNALSTHLNDSLNDALDELNKFPDNKANTVIREIQELSTDEINQMFSNLNSKYHAVATEEDRHMLDTDKIESIIEVILEYSGERNEFTEKVAKAIFEQAKTRDVDYHLMTAIVMQESSFKKSVQSKEKINGNGSVDMSICQINYETWSVEFPRRGLEPLNKERLKKDYNYAIDRMGEIMAILKKEHAKNDKYWYARYHNRKYKEKMKYVADVDKKLAQIRKSELENTKEKLIAITANLKKISFYNGTLTAVNFDKINELTVSLNKVGSMIDNETDKIETLIASNK